MKKIARISRSIGQAWFAGLCFLFTLYIGVPTFQDDGGIAALKSLEKEENSLSAQAAEVALYKNRLEHRIALIGGDELDPDILEEQVRLKLGFSHPDDVTVFMN